MSKEGLSNSQWSELGMGCPTKYKVHHLQEYQSNRWETLCDSKTLKFHGSNIPQLQGPVTLGFRSMFHIILCKEKTSFFEQLPGHVLRRKSVANDRHFVKIGTNRTSHIWSCHSTESHSCKQQGPHGFDDNTNTTCDSIKEAVIKKGEQHAVSPIISSHWGLALLTSGIQGTRGTCPGACAPALSSLPG